jgi:hypothetical protein
MYDVRFSRTGKEWFLFFIDKTDRKEAVFSNTSYTKLIAEAFSFVKKTKNVPYT